MLHNGTTKKFLQINATKSASAEKGKPITAITKQSDPRRTTHKHKQAIHNSHIHPTTSNKQTNT